MAKKITIKQHKYLFRVIAAIVIFLTFFYLVSMTDRFNVVESEHFTETHLIPPGDYLSYSTEFCASKLSDLAQEYHFIESDVHQQEIVEGELELIPEMEDDVIGIEQREMSTIKAEFDEYKALCDRFDASPDAELCSRFINEAQADLDVANHNNQDQSGDKFLDNLESDARDVRKTQRIYEGLRKHCEGIEYE